jgi:hypothetical protein
VELSKIGSVSFRSNVGFAGKSQLRAPCIWTGFSNCSVFLASSQWWFQTYNFYFMALVARVVCTSLVGTFLLLSWEISFSQCL